MSDQVEVIDVEKWLNSTFNPIDPDPEFVKRLGNRLIWRPDSIVIEEYHPQNIKLMVGLLFTAIMGIIIWLLQRAFRSKR